MFTNVMTESDDRARWALAYIEFGLSEVLAVITAYRLPNHNAIGYLAYGLPLFVLVPIVSAQRALTAFKRNPASQNDSVLLLHIYMQLWMVVVASYTLFIFTVAVCGAR
jgi:hypothetical protein